MTNTILSATLLLALLPTIARADQQDSSANQTVAVITREARHEITLLPRYTLFDWIDFRVQPDGTVTLHGQVVGFTLRADAEDAVKRIAGVSKVVNQIEELPQSPSDAQIRRDAYRAIYAETGPLFRYALEIVPTIHIVVANGRLTLHGVVETAADKSIATTNAQRVAGVVGVGNELTVQPTPRPAS